MTIITFPSAEMPAPLIAQAWTLFASSGQPTGCLVVAEIDKGTLACSKAGGKVFQDNRVSQAATAGSIAEQVWICTPDPGTNDQIAAVIQAFQSSPGVNGALQECRTSEGGNSTVTATVAVMATITTMAAATTNVAATTIAADTLSLNTSSKSVASKSALAGASGSASTVIESWTSNAAYGAPTGSKPPTASAQGSARRRAGWSAIGIVVLVSAVTLLS